MAICGHCNAKVKGIRDHIKDKHGEPFYEMGPDFCYYGYWHLRSIDIGLVIDRPHWNVVYEKMSSDQLMKFVK